MQFTTLVLIFASATTISAQVCQNPFVNKLPNGQCCAPFQVVDLSDPYNPICCAAPVCPNGSVVNGQGVCCAQSLILDSNNCCVNPPPPTPVPTTTTCTTHLTAKTTSVNGFATTAYVPTTTAVTSTVSIATPTPSLRVYGQSSNMVSGAFSSTLSFIAIGAIAVLSL